MWQCIQHQDQERLDQLHLLHHRDLLPVDMVEESAVTRDPETLLEVVLFLTVCSGMIVMA